MMSNPSLERRPREAGRLSSNVRPQRDHPLPTPQVGCPAGGTSIVAKPTKEAERAPGCRAGEQNHGTKGTRNQGTGELMEQEAEEPEARSEEARTCCARSVQLKGQERRSVGRTHAPGAAHSSWRAAAARTAGPRSAAALAKGDPCSCGPCRCRQQIDLSGLVASRLSAFC